MKKSLLSCLLTLLCLGSFIDARGAVTPTAYHEDFSTGLYGAQSAAPYLVKYWYRTGASKSTTKQETYDADPNALFKKAIQYNLSNSGTSYETLITPKVGGEVSFQVKRSIATPSYESQLELYIMVPTLGADRKPTWTSTSLGTADGTVNGITISGLSDVTSNGKSTTALASQPWRKVTLTGVPDGTYIGMRLQYLMLDEFNAEKAWLEWMDGLADYTLTPMVDVSGLNSYTLLYLDAEHNWKFDTRIQLKTALKAGSMTADDLKFDIYAEFNLNPADLPEEYKDNPNKVKVGTVTFTDVYTDGWGSNTTITGNETVDLKLDMTLNPGYFNKQFTFWAENAAGLRYQLQRAINLTSSPWSSSSWSNIKVEGLIAQPLFGYNPTKANETSVSVPLFTAGHPFIINPVANEANIAMGNNAGKAEMKITKVEFSDANFALKEDLTFPITVPAKGFQSLKPTLKATEPGVYKGTMSVYVDGFAAPYTVDLEAARKPSDKASYIFHKTDGETGATMPKGWLASGKWDIRPLTSTYTKVEGAWVEAAGLDNNKVTDLTSPFLLITPKLHFEAGEKFWFDANGTGSTTTPGTDILISTDRANWTELRKLVSAPYTISETTPLTDDCFSYYGSSGYGAQCAFRTFVTTIDEAGDYYIAFRTGQTLNYVDNFVGGKEVAVDFDVAYVSSDIKWKANAGKPVTYTMTVCNLGDDIAADAYSVQVLVNGEVVKTVNGSETLVSGVNTPLSVAYSFPADGMAKVSLKLVKGDNSVVSPESDVTVYAQIYEEQIHVGPAHKASSGTQGAWDDYNYWPLTPDKSYEAHHEAVYNKNYLQNINKYGASPANEGVRYTEGDELTGLKAGDKITSIDWLAYVPINNSLNPWPTHLELPVKVYLENTTNPVITGFSDVDFLDEVYSGKAVFDMTKNVNDKNLDKNGNCGTDLSEGVIRVVLDEPFEYTGNHLRVVLKLPKVYYHEGDEHDADAVYFPFASATSSYGASSIYAVFSNTPTKLGGENITDADKSMMWYRSSASGNGYSANKVPMILLGKEVAPTTISGKVTDSATEQPIANATVKAVAETGEDISATTDETGAYTIKTINTKVNYTVTATADGYWDYAKAEPVSLADGNVTLDIAMREKALTVKGIVKGVDGPLANARVELCHALSPEMQAATTDENGAFAIKTTLVTTDHIIKVSAPFYHLHEQRFGVGDVDHDLGEIELEHMTATISGTVKGDDGLMSGAKVTIKDVKTDATEEATTDENGAYSFTVMGLGTDYKITVEAPYYKTYEGQFAIGDQDVNVPEITLEHMTATISGTVKGIDGLMSGATVTIKDVKTDATEEATTDENGAYSFTVKGLDTDYKITVEAEYYETYEGQFAVGVTDVTVPEIVMAHLEVSVSGKVVDEAGEAIEGAKVTFKADDTNSYEATTAADGTFEFSTTLFNSEWTLTVEAEDYDVVEQSVSVTDEDLDLGNITLKKTLGIGAIYADGGIIVTPGTGSIAITADGVKVVVADTMGRVIAKFNKLTGTETVDGLARGIYLVNNVKVVVK